MNDKLDHFTKLEGWKKGHNLVLDIYKLSGRFNNIERFGLTSQMRRAAVSITSNIAEGFARWTSNEKVYFFNISRGSLVELHNQLLISKDLKYIGNEDYIKVENNLKEVEKIICGLIRYFRDR